MQCNAGVRKTAQLHFRIHMPVPSDLTHAFRCRSSCAAFISRIIFTRSMHRIYTTKFSFAKELSTMR
jgi:hypothetical protein